MLFPLSVCILSHVCQCQSVDMYVYIWLYNMQAIIIFMIIKPANSHWLTSFYFSGNMPQRITSYFSSCSFSFEHTGPPSYLPMPEGEKKKNSLKRKEVWLRPAESLAKRPGIVPVAPETPKQLSEVACRLLPPQCLPACPSSGISIGWDVDYLLPEDANTKPNPNLGLDLRGGKCTPFPPLPSLWFDLLCGIILCNKGCRRQSLWGQCLGGMSRVGKGVNVTKRDSATGPLIHEENIWVGLSAATVAAYLKLVTLTFMQRERTSCTKFDLWAMTPYTLTEYKRCTLSLMRYTVCLCMNGKYVKGEMSLTAM